MNSSVAHMISVMHKQAVTMPAAGTSFMQNPLLMGGTAMGVMSGDSPGEMAVKGGAGYLAATALQKWLEQNGHMTEAARVAETIKTQEVRPPSAARQARRDRNAQQPAATAPAPAVVAGQAAPTAPAAPAAAGQPAPVVPAATAATPMTSSRLNQEIVHQRAGLGGLNRDLKSAVGPMAEVFGGEKGRAWNMKNQAERTAWEAELAAKEKQQGQLFQQEQVDNIKMRENAARLQAEKYGLKGSAAEDYVAKQVPEVRTEMVKEAPKGQYYGSKATNAVNVNGKDFYRITNPDPAIRSIYTDHLGNAVKDPGVISEIQGKINKSTYRGDVQIQHPSAEMRPKTTYNTKEPIMSTGHKTSLGRGIGGGVGALAGGVVGAKISDALDLGDTAKGVVAGLGGVGGAIGGSVLGGKIGGGFTNPLAGLNEFGVSGQSKSLMSRMKPAGKLAGGLALLAGGGWLANKMFGEKAPKAMTNVRNNMTNYVNNLKEDVNDLNWERGQFGNTPSLNGGSARYGRG